MDIEVLAHVGTFEVKRGTAAMLKGGVIMDVVTPRAGQNRGGLLLVIK